MVHRAVIQVQPLAVSSSLNWDRLPSSVIGALGQVGHENEGKNNLIGRKPEKEGCQDNAIHPQGPAQRIEKAGEVGKEAHTPEFYIGHKPNDKACGRCDGRGPAQDKHSPIQYGAKKHTPHLRTPVWG